VDSDNYIHVVWVDDTSGDSGINYKKSTDGGACWIAKRLTYNSGLSLSPTIGINSNNHIHVVWLDTPPSNFEIYYKRSTNGGIAWTTKRLTWNLGWSKNPAIAVNSNNHIHIIWYDETPGNDEIYHKKGIQ
jgi:hypothetical protein